MLKKLALIFSLILILAACQSEPTAEDIQAAIQQTEEAKPTETPTNTPQTTAIPTSTPQPTTTPIPPCSIQSEQYLQEINDLFTRWQDAFNLANNTPRVSLSTPIQELQSLKQEAEKITPPDCAQMVSSRLIAYMNYTIDAFLSFASNESDSIVSLNFMFSSAALDLYLDAIEAIQSDTEPVNRVHYMATGSKTITTKYRTDTGIENGINTGQSPSDGWFKSVVISPDTDLWIKVEQLTGNKILLSCWIWLNGELVSTNINNGDTDNISCSYPE